MTTMDAVPMATPRTVSTVRIFRRFRLLVASLIRSNSLIVFLFLLFLILMLLHEYRSSRQQ